MSESVSKHVCWIHIVSSSWQQLDIGSHQHLQMHSHLAKLAGWGEKCTDQNVKNMVFMSFGILEHCKVNAATQQRLWIIFCVRPTIWKVWIILSHTNRESKLFGMGKQIKIRQTYWCPSFVLKKKCRFHPCTRKPAGECHGTESHGCDYASLQINFHCRIHGVFHGEGVFSTEELWCHTMLLKKQQQLWDVQLRTWHT